MAFGPRLTAISGTQLLYNAGGSVLTDASGNSRTLTASGTAAYENGYEGSVNSAFDQDGVWYPYRTGTLGLIAAGDSTIQCYVKIETAPALNTQFDLFSLVTNEASGSRRVIQVSYVDAAGVKKLAYRHGATTTSANQTLTVGTWYAIAIVIDFTGSLARGYVSDNGTTTELINLSLSTANSGNGVGIQVGSGTTGGTIPTSVNPGDFAIDNLRATNTARSQTQINADFTVAAPSGLSARSVLLGVGI